MRNGTQGSGSDADLMPTSAQDPQQAQRQRGSVIPTDFDKEREWWGLWLGGPLLALTVIAALVGLVVGMAELWEWLTR